MRHMTPSTVTAGMHFRHASGAAARRVARRATAGTSPRAMALAMPLAVPMVMPTAVPLAVPVPMATTRGRPAMRRAAMGRAVVG